MMIFVEELPEVNGLDLFLPHPAEIFWSTVVIVILGLAFYKFFLPSVNKILADRSEKIEGEIAYAAQVKIQAQELYDKYTTEIKDARLEAAQIRDDARLEAAQIIAVARTKALQEAELISSNARRTIESERRMAEIQLKRQVASLAMAMTQKMLQNGLDNQVRQSKIIDVALDRFENKRQADEKENGQNPSRRTSANSNSKRMRSAENKNNGNSVRKRSYH